MAEAEEQKKQAYSVRVFETPSFNKEPAEYKKQVQDTMNDIKASGGRPIGYRTDPKTKQTFVVYASEHSETPEDYEIMAWNRGEKKIDSKLPVQNLVIRVDDPKERNTIVVLKKKEVL